MMTVESGTAAALRTQGSDPGEAPVTAAPERRRRWPLLAGAAVLTTALVALLAVASQGGWYVGVSLTSAPWSSGVPAASDPGRQAAAARRLAALAPRGVYVVVDSHRNRLRVLRGGEVMREAVCSTGSGTVLRDPDRGRVWVFDTPLGERRVERKMRNPVWMKPDWAFIEEGFEPPAGVRARVDDVSLGDYGLYLGDGYIIHGTLFQTLLGQRITHGCIRLGDADLKYLYREVPIGARVYIY